MNNLEWDALSYDRISDMQFESGSDFLARVPLSGDETAIDAGCGTGRITELLVERLPRGRVIGVDASRAMIAQARSRLGPDVELVVSDLLEFAPPDPVDVVFSTQALHWILDHDRLFAAIFGWLVPGGLLAAQLGGEGNFRDAVESAVEVSGREPFAEYLRGSEHPWEFPSPERTAERLERAGFVEVECACEERRFQFDEPREFHRTVGAAVHLDRLPEEMHEPFLDAMLAGISDPARAYLVRTTIFARHP